MRHPRDTSGWLSIRPPTHWSNLRKHANFVGKSLDSMEQLDWEACACAQSRERMAIDRDGFPIIRNARPTDSSLFAFLLLLFGFSTLACLFALVLLWCCNCPMFLKRRDETGIGNFQDTGIEDRRRWKLEPEARISRHVFEVPTPLSCRNTRAFANRNPCRS